MPINVIKTKGGFKPTKVEDGKEVADENAKLVHTGDGIEVVHGEASTSDPEPEPAPEASPEPEDAPEEKPKKGFFGRVKDAIS